MIIRFVKLKNTAVTPAKMHPEDACYDLYAAEDGLVPAKGGTFTAMLGIAIELPYGFAGIIKGRSGLTKAGVIVPTGTVDANYRGEIGVTLVNCSNKTFKFKQGDRIAQFCLTPTYSLYFDEVEELNATDRGSQGFGSTGGIQDPEK